MEYLAYAGGNESVWTHDPRYFNRSCAGTIFGKPCLVLNTVCYMNPWARIECVPVPSPDSKIDIYIYHMYGSGFHMKNSVVITAGDQTESTLTPICTIPWPLKGSQQQPRGKHIKELVATITMPQKHWKLVNIRLEVYAADGA